MMYNRLHVASGKIFTINMFQKKYESIWSNVKLASIDEISLIRQEFLQCKSKRKVNLSLPNYQDDSGNSYTLPSVQKAEKLIHSMNLNKEYSPILGESKFCKICVKFVLGDESEYNNNGMAVSVQTIGGAGALKVGFTLIKKFYSGKKRIFIPNPSWKYHEKIIKCSGLELGTYKYYDPMTKDLDFNSMIEDIKKMPDHSVILFNASAHDPTGMDPSHKQWNELSTQIKAKNILPFFDMPFQGLASGDPEQDSYSVRKFVHDGNKVMFALSFSRNMCLYGERTGCLSILVNSKNEAEKLMSQLKLIIRGLYSSPPVNGSRIVMQILEDPGLRADWRSECREMADRMVSVRKAFKQAMLQLDSKINWDHFDRSVGMSTACGLSVEQIERLTKDYFIFMAKSGQMSVAALNSKNIDYITRSFHEVTK